MAIMVHNQGLQNAYAGQLGQAYAGGLLGQLRQQAMGNGWQKYAITVGTSAPTVTYEYDGIAMKMKAALTNTPAKSDSNEAWLDRRVDEMRVRL